MSEYEWAKVAVPVIFTQPPTMHKWIWVWQVQHYKACGWQVEDSRFLKRKVWRETRLEDYIYGDGLARDFGLNRLLNEPLFSDGTRGGIERSVFQTWGNR